MSDLNPHISYPNLIRNCFFQLEDNSFWFRHRNHCIIEILKQFPPNGRLYDVGGGNGVVTKALEENGIETVLVEPSGYSVDNAKKRGVKNVICSTLEGAAFQPNTLPAVGLFDVIEHIQHPKDFLKSIFELLKPDGRLFLTAPAYRSLWSKDDVLSGHFNRYKVKGLRKILMEVGFCIDFATYLFLVLPLPIFMIRSLPSKLGLISSTEWVGRLKRQHSSRGGITEKMLKKVFNFEVNRIKKKKPLPVGSSCLIVARAT
jgi:2-polyprenyl-3-methyl-5-hydroxy-6-metoxy-1,4-benzoquinol methylase